MEKDANKSLMPTVGLGVWNIYFIVKFFLFWKELISLHPLQNLAFAAFLLLPIKSRFVSILRLWLAIPIGIALFYYDSWLPPLHRLVSEAKLLQDFDTSYMFELLGRFVDIDVVAMLVILLAIYLFISRYLRLGVVIVAYLIALNLPLQKWFSDQVDVAPVVDASGATTAAADTVLNKNEVLNQYLNNFYAQEKNRVTSFVAPAETDVPFDILFIQLCSISWEDLEFAQQKDDLPLFDILLSNFSTAASYSGPAVIRILRAGCGQSSHTNLYSDANAQCYLFDSLKRIGYENELVMNHDGHFDDFVGLIKNNGRLNTEPMSLADLPAPLKSFDGTPIHDDLETLERWLNLRDKSDSTRAAVLYNSITLHDGNRYTDHRSAMNSTENFVPRVRGLLMELKAFMQRLQESGRRTLVVMLPEHGAAVKGDKLQISGLREIPSPSIALGPVGIRLIGPELSPPLNPIRFDKPTSYLDVTEIVSRLIQGNPFKKDNYRPADLVKDLQGTEFVAENAGTVVLRHQGRYYVRLEGDSEWIEYPTN